MKKLLQLIFILLAGLSAHAQITGTVKDSLNAKPLEFITVSLRDHEKVQKGTITDVNGKFEFKGIQPGKYNLRISAVGYAEFNYEFTHQSITEIGEVFLKENRNTLEEVKVTTRKPIIHQEADRLTYDVQADPESKAFNVLDMMRKIPYLSLDGEDNLYMKDSRDFRIFINGKPSAMLARNYKDILKSMPASSIQKIEVITTPPAKYDGEGLSGIINIITNKKIDGGYMGNVNLNYMYPIGGPGIGATLTARTGKWGISGLGGGSLNSNPVYTFRNERNTFGATESLLMQQGSRESKAKNAYLGVEVSYELDSLSLFTGQFNVSTDKNNAINTQQSRLWLRNELNESYLLNNSGNGNGGSTDFSLNYQRAARKDKNRLLTMSYLYSGFENRADNRISLSEKLNYPLSDYFQENNQVTREHTGQLDYVYPFRKWNLETGLKAIFRENESSFGSNQLNTETIQRNDFLNTQHIYSLYSSFRYNTKIWGVSGGFRLENTVLEADFMSSGLSVHQNYFNGLPTLSISRRLGSHTVGMGYLQRIQRPGIYQLNPFVDRSNPSIERTGNPDLLPSVMQDLSLKYTYSGKTFVHISVGVISIKDMLFPIITYNGETAITQHSYDNVGKARLLPSIMTSMSRQLTKKWNFNSNIRWTHATVEGIVNGEKVVNTGIMYGFNASSGYKTSKNWRWNANINYNGPSINIQEVRNAYLSSSLTLNKDLLKDKLSFSATVNNPFTEYRRNITDGFGPDFEQFYEQKNYFRSFRVSVNYKFGKLKDGIKKSSRSIRNDDVKNSD